MEMRGIDSLLMRCSLLHKKLNRKLANWHISCVFQLKYVQYPLYYFSFEPRNEEEKFSQHVEEISLKYYLLMQGFKNLREPQNKNG